MGFHASSITAVTVGCPAGDTGLPSVPGPPIGGDLGCCELAQSPFPLRSNRCAGGWAWVQLLGLAQGGQGS